MELVMDQRIVWDPARMKEVEEAKQMIDELTAKGY